ncbi:hypothetical protein ACFQGT_12745 [Natrialbaceae archaeon GCM10025810]
MSDTAEYKAEPTDEDDERDDAHLDDVEVGAGCTEIWEHLAEKREEE